MNTDDMITIAAFKLGNRTDQDANILTQMNLHKETVWERGATLPWFLFAADPDTPLVTVANTEIIAVPDDFLRFPEADSDEGTSWIIDENGNRQKLHRLGYDELTRLFDREATDMPKAYALRGDTLYLGPIPDAVYTLVFPYMKSEDAFANNDAENAWGKHAADVVIAETVFSIATGLQMVNPAFAADVARANKRLTDECTAREEAGRTRKMGNS